MHIYFQNVQFLLTIIIFVISFALFLTNVVEKWLATSIGSLLYLYLGIIHPVEAITFIDFNTIAILFGMGILLGTITPSGLFDLIAVKMISVTKGNPLKTFLTLMITSMIFGSFLYSIAGLLLLLPISIKIAKHIHLDPKLFIVGEILFMDIGGSLTIIGDPSSAIIGTKAGFTLSQFLFATGIPVFMISCVVLFFLYFNNRKYFTKAQKNTSLQKKEQTFIRKLENKFMKDISDIPFILASSILLLTTIFSLFFTDQLHTTPGINALIGGFAALVILHKKVHMKKLIYGIHWKTIIYLAGLFILVGTIEKTGITNMLAMNITYTTTNPYYIIGIIIFITAIVSMFLDNVAFVVIMLPIIVNIQHTHFQYHPELLWWALLFGAVFGGLTLPFGSTSTVGIGIGRKEGYVITTRFYTKYGLIMFSIGLFFAYLYLIFLYNL